MSAASDFLRVTKVPLRAQRGLPGEGGADACDPGPSQGRLNMGRTLEREKTHLNWNLSKQ